MIKGFRKTLLMTSMLSLSMISLSAFGASSSKELVDKVFNFCRDQGGVEDEIGPYDSGDQECMKYKCGVSTPGTVIETADDSSVSLGGSDNEKEGALAAVYRETCVDKADLEKAAQDARDRAREEAFENDTKVSSDGRGSIGGGGAGLDFVIRYDGSVYECRASESKSACARRHNLSFDYDIDFRTSGDVDSNGREIFTISRRSNTGGSTRDNDNDRRSRDRDSGNSRSGRNSDRDSGSSGWYELNVGGRSFTCASSESERECLGDDLYAELFLDVDLENCIHCNSNSSSRYRSSRSSGNSWGSILGGVAQVAGAILPPVMAYKGQKAWANAYSSSNSAWAGAAATGFEQCQLMQTNYTTNTYAHIAANEYQDREVTPPDCNGYQLGSYAGGSYNGSIGMQGIWGGSGYSNQYMGLMQGPYGNGYMTGVGVNGMNMNSGLGLGLQGNLNLNSLLGLPSNGINFGAGLNSGYGSGYGNYGNGYGNYGSGYGNYGSGYGNYGNGYGNYGNGYGNYGGGYTGGLNLNLGLGGNYGNNGYYGNYNGYGNYAGNNGMVPYGNSYGNNGYGSQNGSDWYAVQQNHSLNQQAQQVGSYYQQAALQNQAQQSYYNTNYNSGYSGYSPLYSPMNAGASAQFQFGFGN